MSDRPPDEPGFAYYWCWLAREKIEEEIEEELFHLIRTTPGIPDQSWMVEDVEKASKGFVSARVDHLRNSLEGWEIMEKGMNKEIAVALFNEFTAGSRTLEDFENRNFSKKKDKEQQAKPRRHFPPHLSGNPILTKASISELAQNGGLPSTTTVYSSHSEEFYTQTANNLYYDMIFGDAKIFNDIMQENSRTPNMPAPKVHPMPYHPQMQKPTNFQQFQHFPQVRDPFTNYQQQGSPVQYTQPAPVAFPVNYQPIPQFMPVPMSSIPMQGIQDNVYAGMSYQKPYSQNGNSGQHRRQDGHQPRYPKGRHGRNEHSAKQPNGFENINTSSSSSPATFNKPQSPISEEERTLVKPEETMDEAFPALDQEASTSLEVKVDAQKSLEMVPSPACVVLPTPRKFSDVVSNSVSASTSTADASEDSSPVVTTETDDVASTIRSSVSTEETLPATSDVLPSVASETDAASTDKVLAPSDSALENTDSLPVTSDSSLTNTDSLPATSNSLPATTSLAVDTTEHNAPVVPPVSYRTVAEVVQQSLSAAPSPSAKRVNGVSPAQPSPAVNPSTAATSPAVNGNRQSSSKTSSSSRTKGNTDTHKKSMKSPRKPSLSYAEMLYPKNVKSSNTTGKTSSSSSTTQPSASQPHSSTAVSKEQTDWHTVKNKKAAEPLVLSPPIKASSSSRPSAPRTLPEPAASDDDDDEDVASDDPEAEKKRLKRRVKRQKLKEANRLQKQQEKELARQESLARVEQMKGESKKTSPPPDTSPPPPAFDRNNLAARRKKRQELQRKTEFSDTTLAPELPTSPPPPAPRIPTLPLIPLIPSNMTANPMGASISAGQTAMAAYGLSGQFRHRSSPFAIIAPNGTATLPLFLPPQAGLRTNEEGYSGSILLEETPDQKALHIPVKLVRKVDPKEVPMEKNEIDENASMIEKLLILDNLDDLDIPESERTNLDKGLDDVKTMYARVEKAGQLITYKTGSSKVSMPVEEKLLDLTIKLLSNRVDLSPQDATTVSEIGKKIAHCSASFNYTNYLSALLDFSQTRADELPDGSSLRKHYEQSVVLTKLFLKRTKTVYERISEYTDFPVSQETEK